MDLLTTSRRQFAGGIATMLFAPALPTAAAGASGLNLGVIGAATLPAAGDHDDRELVALGRAFDTLAATSDSVHDALSDAETEFYRRQQAEGEELARITSGLAAAKAAVDDWWNQFEAVVDRIEALPAHTLDGLDVKARVAQWHLKTLVLGDPPEMDQPVRFILRTLEAATALAEARAGR